MKKKIAALLIASVFVTGIMAGCGNKIKNRRDIRDFIRYSWKNLEE